MKMPIAVGEIVTLKICTLRLEKKKQKKHKPYKVFLNNNIADHTFFRSNSNTIS